MLHACIENSRQSTYVDELRTRICDIMHATAPNDAWRHDEVYELQSQREASEWRCLITMAEPGKSSPPYLRLVHAWALAITMGITIIFLSDNDTRAWEAACRAE